MAKRNPLEEAKNLALKIQGGLRSGLQQAELARIASSREGYAPKQERLTKAQNYFTQRQGPILSAPVNYILGAAKNVVGGLETASQGRQYTGAKRYVNPILGGLEIGYGLGQATPIGAGLKLGETGLSTMLQAARTTPRNQPAFGGVKNIASTFSKGLGERWMGVGTTGLGVQGLPGMALDIALQPQTISSMGKKLLQPKTIAKGATEGKRVLTAPTDLLFSREGSPDKKRVADYMKLVMRGGEIEPIYVIREGAKYGIVDGKHRFEAFKQLGIKDIPIELMEKKGKRIVPIRGEGGRFEGSFTMGLVDNKPPKGVGEIRVTSKAIKDYPQQVKIKDGVITITGRINRKKVGEVSFPVNDWTMASRKYGNELYGQAEFLKNKLEFSGEYGTGAQQVIDAQQSAINEALSTINKKAGVVMDKRPTLPTSFTNYTPAPKGVGEISQTPKLPGSPVEQISPPGLKPNQQPPQMKMAETITGQPGVKVSTSVPEQSSAMTGAGPRPLTETIPQEKYAFNINKQRLDLNESELKTLDSAVATAKPELEKLKGKTLSHQEVVDAARQSEMLQQVTTREQTLQAEAAMLKARQQMASLDKKIDSLIKEGKTAEAESQMKELIESLKVVSSNAADKGRQLNALKIEAGDESIRQGVLKDVLKVEADTNKILKEAAKVDWTDANSVATFYRKFIKPNFNEIIDEYRYNAMLSNPRTHLRNAFSNTMQVTAVRPLTLLFEGKFGDVPKYYKGVLGSLGDAKNAFLNSYSGKGGVSKPDLEHIPTMKLPKLFTIPTRAMEASDKFFSTLIQGGEMARGETKEAATDIARYSLFRQQLHPKGQGYVLNKIDDLTEGVYGLGNKFPPFRWFVPFIQTPMNFAKQWIEYSPLGTTTMIGAKNKREQLAKTMIGSVALSMGAYAALEDRTSWAAPTDKKEKDLFYASGRKPFSVKVGDTWVPMMYLGPWAYAVALPAAYKHYTEDTKTALSDTQLEKIKDSVLSMTEFLSGQTFMEGLENFTRLMRGDVDYSLGKNLGYTAAQIIPFQGLMRYISSIVDPVYRKTDSAKEQFLSTIPGYSRTLPAYTTPQGQESTRERRNLVTPYDLSSANKTYEIPLQARRSQQQYNNLINKAYKEIESGTIPATKEGRYLTAEYIYSYVHKTSDKAEQLQRLKELENKGLVTPEVVPLLSNIKKLDDDYMTKTYRQLLLYDPLSRAQAILDLFDKIDKKETKQLRYDMLKKYGVLTPEVEQYIVQLKQ